MDGRIPQFGDGHFWSEYTGLAMTASTSRATVSGLTVTMTYEPLPSPPSLPPIDVFRNGYFLYSIRPGENVRRYTLAPRTPLIAWLLILMLALLAVAWFAPGAFGQTFPTTQPSTQPATIKYIGCYKQRARDLKAWAGRGINLALLSESENGTVDRLVWRAAARAAGLVYIDTYASDADADDPSLIGWSLTDSDEWNRGRGPLNARQPTAPLVAEAQKLAALNAAKGTNKLIFANADGPTVTTALFEKPPYDGVKNNEKAVLPFLSARSVDWYPIISIPSTLPSEIARRPLYLPAQAAWRIRSWSDQVGAPPAQYMAIVEAAKGFKSPISVTGDQMRETVDYLMGARPFPVPDANGKPVMVQGKQIDMLVFWTANGQDGPGWNWFASNGDQEAAIVGITAKFKTANIDPVAVLQSKVAALDAQIGVLNDAIGAQGQTIAALTRANADQQSRLATAAKVLAGTTQPTTQP